MKELEKPIQAWIGVDWADQKHDVSLYEVSVTRHDLLPGYSPDKSLR